MFLRLIARTWLLIASSLLLIFVGLGIAIAALNPRLTRYVEGPAFLAEMNKQTAKGLHFPAGQYQPFQRPAFFTITSAGFKAEQGQKALRAIDAHGITARFNPWGVFLRRWQLDEVRIESGTVEIQTYEPKPEPKKAKPWYHIFLPDRVYLKLIEANPVDVTWQLRGDRGGFFHTQLEITPHGRDFNYAAIGGTMKTPGLPDLPLRETRMLITKQALTLYHLDLDSNGDHTGRIHGEGKAGTGQDKSVDFRLNFERVPVSAWLPAAWREHTEGRASGNIAWRGKDPKLESAQAEAALKITGGRVQGLPLLEKLGMLTGEKSIANLKLDECAAELTWKSGAGRLQNIAIEDRGKIRLEGDVTLQNDQLGGLLKLGAAPRFLQWLPKSPEIFHPSAGDYRWATVHLSGTLSEPQQDLSSRVLEAMRNPPAQPSASSSARSAHG